MTNTITAYWELAFARENVKVQQQAVTVAQKLYEDNKKQLEIGTMAPLDVTRAKSELATDRQNLIVAQTIKLQDEQILKNAISKDPFFFQAEDGIRDYKVTGVQTCALPIYDDEEHYRALSQAVKVEQIQWNGDRP